MSIEITLHEYVTNTFIHADPTAELTAETPLLELGVLDSFSMLRLVSWIEEQFSIKLAADEITADNFCSLQTIAATIERHIPRP